MSETTAIEWCDSTFNPWMGCTKISPACDHCYAEALMDTRHHRVKWGGSRVRTSTWHEPKRWQRQAAAFFAEHRRRRRVFCASLADVFDNQVPTDWRDDLWTLIRECPDLDWLLLTKRPQNIGKMLPTFWDEVKGHVWLGTTVEDQKRAAHNIPYLLEHDSAVRFISAEPLLGRIAIDNYLRALPIEGHRPLDWVIAGGESGPQARPSHPDWFYSLRDQCAEAGTAFLYKQWGDWGMARPAPAGTPGRYALAGAGPQSDFWPQTVTLIDQYPRQINLFGGGKVLERVGKKAAGRRLQGVEHNGFPEARA